MEQSNKSAEKSEYELQRLKRIERNNERLKALGLLSRYEEQEAEKARKKAAASDSKKRKFSAVTDPERKSSRVQSGTETSAATSTDATVVGSNMPASSSTNPPQGAIMYVVSDRDKENLSERHFRTFRQFMWFGEPDTIRRWTVCRHCHNKRHQKDIETFSKNFHGLCKHLLEECPGCPKKLRQTIAVSQTQGRGSLKSFLIDLWQRPTPDILSHTGAAPTKASSLLSKKKKKKPKPLSDRPDVGDKLEVLWDLEVRGEQEKYWWKAEVISSNGKGSFAVVKLEYVPYPGAGYHQPSHQNVVFLDKNKLMDSDTKDECPYKIESRKNQDAESSDEEGETSQAEIKVNEGNNQGDNTLVDQSTSTTSNSQASNEKKVKAIPKKKVSLKKVVLKKKTISSNKIIQTLAKNKNPAVLKGGYISATQQIVLPPRKSKYDRSTWWNVDLVCLKYLDQGATPLFKRCMRNFDWSEEHTKIVLTGYRQFLWLLSTESPFKNEKAIPCTDVEQMWKEHASDTLHYLYDMQMLCGRVIFYEANRNVDNSEANSNFASTCKALKEKFWTDFLGSLWSRRSQCNNFISAGETAKEGEANQDEELFLDDFSLESRSLAEMGEEKKTEGIADESNIDISQVDTETLESNHEVEKAPNNEVDGEVASEIDEPQEEANVGVEPSELDTGAPATSAVLANEVAEEKESISGNCPAAQSLDKSHASDFDIETATETRFQNNEEQSTQRQENEVEVDPASQKNAGTDVDRTSIREEDCAFTVVRSHGDTTLDSEREPIQQETSGEDSINEGLKDSKEPAGESEA